MDILALSQASRIGIAKLKWLERNGYLTGLTEPDPILSPMKHYLARKGELTTEQMVALIEQPELIDQLGRHTQRAKLLLNRLGHVKPAPEHVAWAIVGAASNDPYDVATIVEWAKIVIPVGGEADHHYLAVRLLLAVLPAQRAREYKRLRRVMLNLRKHPDFAGWWRIEKQGSRNVTIYVRPGGFDL